MLYYTEDFPEKAPQLSAISKLTSPSISDGRNILEEVIKGEWTKKTNITDVVTKITEFLKRMVKYCNFPQVFEKIGYFTLGQKYLQQDIMLYPDISFYTGFELLRVKGLCARFIAVTDSYFLSFQFVPDTEPKVLCLIQAAHLQTLYQIRKKKQSTDTIIMLWKIKNIQILCFERCVHFILDVCEKFRKLEIEYKTDELEGPQLLIEEQSIRNVTSIDFEGLEGSISALEASIELVNESEKQEAYKKLLNLYQSAIDYVSAFKDSRLQKYTDKKTKLLMMPGAAECLSSHQVNINSNKLLSNFNQSEDIDQHLVEDQLTLHKSF